MYKPRIVSEVELDKINHRYRGGRAPVFIPNCIYLRLQIRDLDHFYKLVTFLNKNVGHAKWRINRVCKKSLTGARPFHRNGIKRTIILPADAKELVTAIHLM